MKKKASFETYLEGHGLWGRDTYIEDGSIDISHSTPPGQEEALLEVSEIFDRAKKVRITVEEIEE